MFECKFEWGVPVFVGWGFQQKFAAEFKFCFFFVCQSKMICLSLHHRLSKVPGGTDKPIRANALTLF